ncbi:hypothetical protein NEOC65_000955 [Neochlamydia sp. AcF65]|nr:hypothetical protein [Neochlamydia sp. AcF65]MBS4170522.1 hypothetical protein [Neochlamydia sp. AcF95]
MNKPFKTAAWQQRVEAVGKTFIKKAILVSSCFNNKL